LIYIILVRATSSSCFSLPGHCRHGPRYHRQRRGRPGVQDDSATLRSAVNPLLFPCYSIPGPWTMALSSTTSSTENWLPAARRQRSNNAYSTTTTLESLTLDQLPSHRHYCK